MPSTNHIDQRLQALLDVTAEHYNYFLGLPGALDLDVQALSQLQQRFFNNIGDPYIPHHHALSTHEFEREVLDFFAKLFHAKPETWWGYVTNGSTECNLFALYLARQKLPKAKVYYSKAAHFSVPKATHILGQEGIVIGTTPDGCMDYEDLATKLKTNKAESAIILATIGTTMSEAKDDVTKIRQALEQAGVKQRFIHSDAALAGPYLALLQLPHAFDFGDGADSVGISGHKFFGSPIPCGVVLVSKADRELLNHEKNYTGTVDATITGSRNGHTPLYLWYAIEKYGLDGLKQRAVDSLAMAEYAYKALQQMNWPTWRNPNALTVMLASPPEELISRWQLATQDGWSHIICMPGIAKEKVDRFLADLSKQSVPHTAVPI